MGLLEEPSTLYISLSIIITLTLFVVIILWPRDPKVVHTPPFPSKTITIDGFEVHYQVHSLTNSTPKTAPTLLLLHGIGASQYCWRLLTPLLSSHFNVVTLDLPGFGASSKIPTANYGLDDQYQRVLTFCDQLQLQTPHLLGSSMGGTLALWCKLQNQKRFGKVITISPATNPKLVPPFVHKLKGQANLLSFLLTKPIMKLLVSRSVTKKELVHHQSINHYFSIYKYQPSAISIFFKATTLINDSRLPHAFSQLDGHDTLTLYGRNDRVVDIETFFQFKETQPCGTFIEHSWGGHHLQEDDPRWVANQVHTFLLSKV